MLIKVEQADIDNAKEKYCPLYLRRPMPGQTTNVCKSCVVFQACARVGIPVKFVFNREIQLQDDTTLPLSFPEIVITCLEHDDWQNALGKEFEVLC